MPLASEICRPPCNRVMLDHGVYSMVRWRKQDVPSSLLQGFGKWKKSRKSRSPLRTEWRFENSFYPLWRKKSLYIATSHTWIFSPKLTTFGEKMLIHCNCKLYLNMQRCYLLLPNGLSQSSQGILHKFTTHWIRGWLRIGRGDQIKRTLNFLFGAKIHVVTYLLSIHTNRKHFLVSWW